MTYYVCDKCGNLATVTAQPMPEEVAFACDKCGSEALWAFPDPTKAYQHAALILERRRP